VSQQFPEEISKVELCVSIALLKPADQLKDFLLILKEQLSDVYKQVESRYEIEYNNPQMTKNGPTSAPVRLEIRWCSSAGQMGVGVRVR
jgi:hypothetical protein